MHLTGSGARARARAHQLAFWFCGYALAFGESWHHFLGTTKFFLVDVSGKDYAHFIFQLPFAATATTIVSGSMAERTRLNSYLVRANETSSSLNRRTPAHLFTGSNGPTRHLRRAARTGGV